MESTQTELKQLAATTMDAAEKAARELSELQLVMLGAGGGEVTLV
jgi:hypothetical protein